MVIGVSCTFYMVAETALIIKTRNTKGLSWVFFAGLSGGLGLAATAYSPLDIWLCNTFGCYLSGNTWWFFLTDVSMWCIYKYIMTRSQSEIWQIVPNAGSYVAVPQNEIPMSSVNNYPVVYYYPVINQ